MDRADLPGNPGGQLCGAGVPAGHLLVFLVLAAQYESLTLPIAIILIVPMGILAAMTGVGSPRVTTTCSRRSGSSCWWGYRPRTRS